MKLRSELTLRKIGNDYIIVNPEKGVMDMSTVFKLNSSSAYIWTSIEGIEFDIESIVGALQDKYEVSPELARGDAAAFIEFVSKKGMLEE
ncbi:PqqD family protein [Sphingobacterium kyonggiense]